MSRMSWPLLCAVSVASVAVACASIQPRMAPPPLLPFQTTFHHWDHHWFQWTPTHPLYESIEGASTKSPSGQDLVWVWLTERVGTKRQVHYLNDLQAATRPSGEAYYRDIRYRAIGTFGSPLGLEVRFKDKDDADVEWTIRMDEDGAFDAQGAGLTDQSGHGAAQFFLIFFREKSRRASSSRLTIGGADFSFPNDPTLAPRYRFQAAYSFNIFVASIPYGEGRVDVTNHGIVLRPFGGGVELLRQRDAPVYRSQSADGDVVEQAESHRAFGFGMMPRRAYGAEGVVRLPRDHRVDRRDHRAYRAQGSRSRGWRQDRVGVDPDVTRLGNGAKEALDVRARMDP